MPINHHTSNWYLLVKMCKYFVLFLLHISLYFMDLCKQPNVYVTRERSSKTKYCLQISLFIHLVTLSYYLKLIKKIKFICQVILWIEDTCFMLSMSQPVCLCWCALCWLSEVACLLPPSASSFSLSVLYRSSTYHFYMLPIIRNVEKHQTEDF